MIKKETHKNLFQWIKKFIKIMHKRIIKELFYYVTIMNEVVNI